MLWQNHHVPKIFPAFCQQEYVQTAINSPIVRWCSYLFSLCAAWTLTTFVQQYSCSSVQEGNISTSCGHAVGTHTTLRQQTYLQKQRTTYGWYYTQQVRGRDRPSMDCGRNNKASSCRHIIRGTLTNTSVCMSYEYWQPVLEYVRADNN